MQQNLEIKTICRIDAKKECKWNFKLNYEQYDGRGVFNLRRCRGSRYTSGYILFR